MNMPDLYSMRSEDEDLDLGIVYASSQETLRLFGATYMHDSETSGSLMIVSPKGVAIATFDVWQNRWVDAADIGA